MRVLTKEEAKELLVKYHMIHTNDDLVGHEGIIKVMDRLQSIQQDPLDVVGRNTDLVMQSRVKDYRRNGLETLLYDQRVLIDGWDKMMAVYQTKDYNLLEEVRKTIADHHILTLTYRNQLDALKIIEEVKNEFKDGPKFASQIQIGGIEKSVWGHSKLSSAALDYLFFKGDIGVRMKNNTQKQYDLIARLINKDKLEKPFSNIESFIEYFLLRRIKALGICRDKNGIHLSGPHIGKSEIRNQYFKILIDKKLIEEVKIDGLKDRFFIPKEAFELSNLIMNQISFIAPLDNLIWDRDFIEYLFDFKYRWEVYTPLDKREYGYYVLPILHKTDFIGRIEFEKHRKNEPLVVKNIWLNDNFSDDELLKHAINRFEAYLVQ